MVYRGFVDQERGRRHPGFAVAWEAHPWDREPDRGASRRAQLAARGPYRAAIPADIANATVEIDAGLQAEAEDAFAREYGTSEAPAAPRLGAVARRLRSGV